MTPCHLFNLTVAIIHNTETNLFGQLYDRNQTTDFNRATSNIMTSTSNSTTNCIAPNVHVGRFGAGRCLALQSAFESFHCKCKTIRFHSRFAVDWLTGREANRPGVTFVECSRQNVNQLNITLGLNDVSKCLTKLLALYEIIVKQYWPWNHS